MKFHGHTRRPSIGITPDVTSPTADAPLLKYDVKIAYSEAVLRAGGLPFILPYSDDKQVVDAYLDRVSGVLITGGAFDIPPEAYGEAAREGLGALKPGRTNFEMLVLRGALSRRMPILGICGGMQLLNVAYKGGSLFQDLERELPGATPHEQKHDRTHPHHPVEIRDHTILSDCLGKGQLMVNSTHHQAVKAVGDGLIASAFANDGVIEAIEAKDGFVVGVQWHPELLIDTVPPHLGLYKTFVNKARDRRH